MTHGPIKDPIQSPLQSQYTSDRSVTTRSSTNPPNTAACSALKGPIHLCPGALNRGCDCVGWSLVRGERHVKYRSALSDQYEHHAMRNPARLSIVTRMCCTSRMNHSMKCFLLLSCHIIFILILYDEIIKAKSVSF
jgi:hypothetical protein